VRLPSFVVTTEVVFGGPRERLIMRHDPGLTRHRHLPHHRRRNLAVRPGGGFPHGLNVRVVGVILILAGLLGLLLPPLARGISPG
jgi:hypothetical protein